MPIVKYKYIFLLHNINNHIHIFHIYDLNLVEYDYF